MKVRPVTLALNKKYPYSSTMMSKLKAITIFYVVVLTILAIIPTQTVAEAPSFSDKLGHFLAFLILGVLFLYSFKSKAFLIIYPVFHEGSQLFVSWRVFDFSDLLANFMGITCAFTALYFVNKNKKETETSRITYSHQNIKLLEIENKIVS